MRRYAIHPNYNGAPQTAWLDIWETPLYRCWRLTYMDDAIIRQGFKPL
jgi:hypothetical protein